MIKTISEDGSYTLSKNGWRAHFYGDALHVVGECYTPSSVPGIPEVHLCSPRNRSDEVETFIYAWMKRANSGLTC